MSIHDRGASIERVAVVGAGIAGCHAATELAAAHDVVVFDAADVAAEATGRSAGLVAPTLFYGDLPDVARHANEFVREFDGSHGFSFTRRRRLDFIDGDGVADAKAAVERLTDAGFDVRYLDGSEATAEFPRIDTGPGGGAVVYEDTGWVDPHTYANALRTAAEAAGATFERGVEVTDVLAEGGRVVGVDSAAGRYDADAVVLAAGRRTPTLLPDGVALSTRPYRTQCVVLEPNAPLDEGFPLGRLPREHLYFRPEHNGDLLVGGAHETVDEPASASSDVDESFVRQVASVVPSVVDGFDDAGVVGGWAGIDIATPDTRPIIDRPPGATVGVVVATGFNGLGIMSSPIVGPTVRERLTGDVAPFSTAPFEADRFDGVGSNFAYTSTSEL
jgi:sarcosine oxidase, subunit beta